MGTRLRTGKLHKQFGRRVKVLRQDRGLTQEALASLINVDRSYMGFIERGEKNITMDKIGKLAEALKVKERDLFEF